MKNLKITLFCVIFLSSVVHAFEPEEKIPDERKVRLKSTLQEILKNGDIDKRVYDDAILRVDSFPCDGVDRSLAEAEKSKLSIVVSNVEQLEKAEVLQLFSYKNWKIVYVNTYTSDETYIFFDQHPSVEIKPVLKWSGAATIYETSEIEKWIIDRAKDIPKDLASCFAWHVTLNRD